jgi:hypothetical protein
LTVRRIYLAPGHGLFVLAAPWNSVTLANWGSDRGGYELDAGEDETDAVIASEIRRIVLLHGGTVHAPRELDDFTLPGTGPTGGPVANRDFPRLWQQNPVYFLRVPGAWAAPANDKSLQGASARANHVRRLARAPAQIDLMLAIHTNGFRGRNRGCLTEYLNVDGPAGNGNALGESLSLNVHGRILARTHIGESPSAVTTMDRVNSVSLSDLTQTFDHWVLDDGGINGVCQQRVLQPAGAGPPYAVPAGHTAATGVCWNRTHRDAAGNLIAPLPAGHAAGTQW